MTRYDLYLRQHDQNEYCALCGLIIPKLPIEELPKAVRRTIDHLRPRSKGGSNKQSNRKPAHYHCNNAKKDLLAVTGAWVTERQKKIAKEMQPIGITFTPLDLCNAMDRVKVPVQQNHRGRNRDPWERISYWEDDGGPPGCYTER